MKPFGDPPGTFSPKINSMRKVNVYVWGSIMLLGAVVLGIGCGKTSDSTEELVGNWSRASDFDGYARSESVSFVIGNYVYLSTGITDRDRFNDLWEYSHARKYWTQRADLPGTARNSAVAFAIDGKGYIGTGYDGTNKLNDFWQYDPSSNSWTQKASFTGSARYDAVGFALSGKGYISSGYDGNYLKDLWQYDPLTDSWTQKASIGGSKRMAATSFVISDKAYVVSGANNGSALNDLWAYDPATDSWEEKRKISNVSDDEYDDDYSSIARYNGVAFQMGSYIYFTGGENGSLLSTTWEYNAATDIWTQRTGFEGTARTGAIAFSLGDRGFVLTGRSGSLSFDNMYEFDPTAEQDDDDN